MTNRDEEFRAFFEAEFRPLRRVAFLLTGDWAEAEDLAQDAMVRTYRAWRHIRERERPHVYARSVLVNRRRSLLRRSRVARKHEELFRSQGWSPTLSEDGVVLWEAIRSLPGRQRAAVVLRFYEDLPEAEVALILDMPIGTVKSQVHRAIARLRDQLGAEWSEVGRIGGSETHEA